MKKRKDGRYCRKVTLNDGTTKFFYSSAANERAAERDINRQILNFEEEEHAQKYNFLKFNHKHSFHNLIKIFNYKNKIKIKNK